MLHTHHDMNKECTINGARTWPTEQTFSFPDVDFREEKGHIVTLVGRAGVRPNSICSATHLSLGQFVVGKKQSLELDPLQYLQNFSGLGENTRLKGSHALKGRGKAV